MSNEIVKYDSELNTIPLRKFSPVEMNLFFSIVSRMRDKSDDIVHFSFYDLKELSNYKMTATKAFVKDLENTYDKLMELKFSNRSASGLSVEKFRMFTRFKINGDSSEPYVEIQVHDMALPLLNNLEQWVRYSLTEFRDLSSGYSKTMFRLLKQFRTTGYAYFTKEDFNEILDIPKSYRETNINQYVIKPIKEELTPLFRGLTIKKKYGKGRGKPVIGYQFSFKPESKNADDFSKTQQEEQRKKFFNIDHNSELTQEEKWLAKDKVLGLRLGTHEQDFKVQQEKQESDLLSEIQKKGLLEDLQKGFLN